MYSIVTVSPFFGITPSPSLRTVLVTPMITDVREKLRWMLEMVGLEEVAVDSDINVRGRVRSGRDRESMRRGEKSKVGEKCGGT